MPHAACPSAVHLLITGLVPGMPVQMTAVSEAKLPVSWSRLIAVPVEENTGLDSRTEQFKGNVNPHVIRRAPFETYEVIEPVVSPVKTEGDSLALRLDVRIAAEASPGDLSWTVIIQQGEDIAKVRLAVLVHDVLRASGFS